MTIVVEIYQAVMNGNAKLVKELTEKALAEGVEPSAIISDGFIPGMAVVGTKMKNGEMFVPEVLMAARAMQTGLGIVKPLMADCGVTEKGTVVIGTVKGDLHDIGKNLVSMLLEGAGYRVVDIGIDVPSDKFVQVANEQKADVIGLSALLTTTMVNMKECVRLLKNSNPKFKVIIGGAPVTSKFADEIGADGYAGDAATAVEIVNRLLASKEVIQ